MEAPTDFPQALYGHSASHLRLLLLLEFLYSPAKTMRPAWITAFRPDKPGGSSRVGTETLLHVSTDCGLRIPGRGGLWLFFG